ncbi:MULTISPECIES: AMP-dependent synthetase/ligase [Kordiimonas]|jgi:long-chain acyl-CoA synthetase|uniref:AMP-dependent synthetase/ligase n=1 Tax=Kordiimonas TaxID=288021 RepID=UPI00257AD4E6|nr:AMP-binding protein [Kordiimonas sp. UBA4487]
MWEGNSVETKRKTVMEDLAFWAGEKPDAPFLVDLKDGRETPFTWRETAQTVDRAARAIHAHFGERDHKAAILSKNRAHWIMADLAILKSGSVAVPVFTTMRPETFHYVLDFADVELLFLGESANWAEVKAHVPEGITIVTLPGIDATEGDITWDDFLKQGDGQPAPTGHAIEDIATLIFTSGTTGKPKGVMHSLGSIGRATKTLVEQTESSPGWHFISYLPLAHLAERLIIELHALSVGGTIFFNESLETFGQDLRIAKPNYFFGVPRIWDKLSSAVIAGTEGGADALKAALTGPHASMAAAAVRDKLGLASVEKLVSTTAPVPPHIKEWFDLFGLPLMDGYGQTEILPLATTPAGSNKPHTVGKPAPGVEVRITEEGELIARGPGCSLGYYKMPEKTAETFRDGWVHTGDRAELDEDGFVILKGRVKETFKTAKGKYVAPMPIEAKFLESDYLDQACLVGHGMPQTVILLVVAETATHVPASEIEAHVRERVAEINAGLERHAQVGAVLMAPEAWTIENGILTHTMKVRRDRVLDRFGGAIEKAGQSMGNGATLTVEFL